MRTTAFTAAPTPPAGPAARSASARRLTAVRRMRRLTPSAHTLQQRQRQRHRRRRRNVGLRQRRQRRLLPPPAPRPIRYYYDRDGQRERDRRRRRRRLLRRPGRLRRDGLGLGLRVKRVLLRLYGERHSVGHRRRGGAGWYGANGGTGGDAFITDAVDGAGYYLNLTQNATGGAGGYAQTNAGSYGNVAGNGGFASSYLTYTND